MTTPLTVTLTVPDGEGLVELRAALKEARHTARVNGMTRTEEVLASLVGQVERAMDSQSPAYQSRRIEVTGELPERDVPEEDE